MTRSETASERQNQLGDPETGGTLVIDLNAIEENFHTLTRLLPASECAAVVKANAYGLGLEPVTAKLAHAGCRTFFVADLAEARRVRACVRDAAVYVLNGFSVEAAAVFAEINVQPVINTLPELTEWDAFVAADGWRGGAAIHVDTGMNRLGISVAEAAALASRLRDESHGFTLLMSHLACAELPDHPLNASQIRQFRELRLLYRGVPASLANSSGIFLGEQAHFDMVRAGAALYGINPKPGRANPMRSTIELSGRILQLRQIRQGETVGYGGAWTARRPSRLAVASIGYADGLLRAASGSDDKRGTSAVIAGKRCPIAGNISMDLACIDVTALADDEVRRGDFAIFIGEQITLEEVAE
jgi:alanine racemase